MTLTFAETSLDIARFIPVLPFVSMVLCGALGMVRSEKARGLAAWFTVAAIAGAFGITLKLWGLVPDDGARIGGEPALVIEAAPAFAPHHLSLLDDSSQMRPLDELEAEIIRFAIAHYRGQMSEVARRLRIGRSTLYRKLESLQLSEQNRQGSDAVVAE